MVHNEWLTPQVMEILKACGIDYYTRWDKAQGKGRWLFDLHQQVPREG